MTLSGDLRSLRGIVTRRAEPLDGHVHWSPDQTQMLLDLIDGLVDRAQSMEAQLGARPPVPADVVVLHATILRFPARPEAEVAG